MSQTETGEGRRSVIIDAYRRIGAASKKGVGIRLSFEECWEIWNYDTAISAAVLADDEDEQYG